MNNDPLKILIIDDDSFLSDMYALKFGQAGHEVEVVPGADEGLQTLESDKTFDVLLLDLVMPGTDGFEFISAAREKGLLQETTVIALTNQSREEDIKKAESFGIKGYIVKASSVPSEVVTSVLEIKGAQNDSIIVKH